MKLHKIPTISFLSGVAVAACRDLGGDIEPALGNGAEHNGGSAGSAEAGKIAGGGSGVPSASGYGAGGDSGAGTGEAPLGGGAGEGGLGGGASAGFAGHWSGGVDGGRENGLGEHDAGAGGQASRTSTFWSPSVIPVCWEVPGPDQLEVSTARKTWVEAAVNRTWETESNVSFTGWKDCQGEISYGLRIAALESGLTTRGLGTQLNEVPGGLVLRLEDCQGSPEACVAFEAAHEFGHALGYGHEDTDSCQACSEPSECNGTPCMAGACRSGWLGDPGVEYFDSDSVMSRCDAVGMFKESVMASTMLSSWDIAGSAARYGSPRPIVVTSLGPDGLHVFVRGPTGRVLQKTRAAAIWSPPDDTYHDLGAPLLGPSMGAIYGKPSVVARAPNRLDVFVRGADARLYHKRWDGSRWLPPGPRHAPDTGWTALGGHVNGSPTAISSAPDRVDVFIRGADNRLLHKVWIDETGWWPDLLGFDDLGGVVLGEAAVISRGDNRMDLFVRTWGDDGLYHKEWTGQEWRPPGPAGWENSGWESLGASVRGSPAAVALGTDRMMVFIRGEDDALYSKKWDGKRWLPSAEAFEFLGGRILGSPTAVSPDGERVDVFVRGADSALYQKTLNGDVWLPAKAGELDGGFFFLADGITASPAAIAPSPTHIDVFFRDARDKTLRHAVWDQAVWPPEPRAFERVGGPFE